MKILPGMLAGVAGLLVFLVVHHLWIQPIWFILPVGLLIAGLGGVAVGWAYRELLPHLPPQPWLSLALVAMILVILLPALILAELRAPMFEISAAGSRLTMSISRAATLFVLELLVTATVMGGGLGWLLGRTKRAVYSTALAGFVFALGPGHNIPFLGNTPGALKGFLILLASVFVAAVVLVVADRFNKKHLDRRTEVQPRRPVFMTTDD